MKKAILFAVVAMFATMASAFTNADHVIYQFITGDTDICGSMGYQTVDDDPPYTCQATTVAPPYLTIGAPVDPENFNVWLPQCNSNDDGEPFLFVNKGSGTITVNAENDIYGVETIDGGASVTATANSAVRAMCVFDVDNSVGQWITVPAFG
jgi:hypothetical protein